MCLCSMLVPFLFHEKASPRGWNPSFIWPYACTVTIFFSKQPYTNCTLLIPRDRNFILTFSCKHYAELGYNTNVFFPFFFFFSFSPAYTLNVTKREVSFKKETKTEKLIQHGASKSELYSGRKERAGGKTSVLSLGFRYPALAHS